MVEEEKRVEKEEEEKEAEGGGRGGRRKRERRRRRRRRGIRHAITHVWRPQDNFVESVLSLHPYMCSNCAELMSDGSSFLFQGFAVSHTSSSIKTEIKVYWNAPSSAPDHVQFL